MPDDGLKSAYELAMERLQAEDREAGIEKPRPLTAEQKEQIARVRQEHKAKFAELEILHKDQVAAAAGEPTKLHELEEHYKIDRDRADSSLESAISAIKSGD